MLSATSYL